MAAATAIVAPQLVGSDPTVLNTGSELCASMPLVNVGSIGAPSVFVTSITAGSALRQSPQSFPVFVGNLEVGNDGVVNARFSAAGLVIGQKLLLTVRGTYGPVNARVGFTVNRYIVVPAAAPYPVALLKAHVQVVVQPAVWTYTIVNDEPAASPQFLSGFSLSVAAPVSVTGTPPGWDVETDSSTFVFWFATDEAVPFPHHVRPGVSLSGFQIQSATSRSESTPYLVSSWRQDTNEAGLVAPDVILSPGRAT